MASPRDASRDDTALHDACRLGKFDKVRQLLFEGRVDINSRHRGRTPVLKAAYKGHRDVLDLLVSKGCDVSLPDDDGNNILHVACIGGHVKIVKHVIKKDFVSINSRGHCGRTPLMVAAKTGHKEVFDLLLSKGCAVSLVDGDGNNILHLACIGQHMTIVKDILSHDIIDVNSREQSGRTPLMLAATKGHHEVFDLLVNKGAVMALVDDDGNNILHLACFGRNVKIVNFIVSENIVDVNSRGEHGRTPLMLAAMRGHRDVLDLLVSVGGTVGLLDHHGNNILHLACIGGLLEMVKHVLSHYIADIKSMGQNGMTPAMLATCFDHEDVYHLLVNRGARKSVSEDDIYTTRDVKC
ncbi:ankyrin repeat domain-containing protein 27-like [Haliotis rubra]|uniref:ankyrin repeat domain-containing protein 27-like n=1 Tax=Haliotis rubra TaxID=36100 RepID=UPI001EE5F132|nr:ankyrin repeat domain-containing protein 27-like [Haliotis rubra]